MNEHAQHYGYGLPIDISTHGYQIDRVINTMHIFMIVLFIGWFCFFVYTLYKFRARPGHKANYAPAYTKFSTYLEVGVVLFEFLVLFVLAMPAWHYAKAALPSGKNIFPVRVVAEQFAWNIQYPGEDGIFGRTSADLVSIDNPVGLDREDPHAKDDVLTINDMFVPVKRKVVVYLSSKDVIHSFFVPVLRVKQDAVPGATYPIWFEAIETGTFDIACAQLCGLSHYRMRGSLTIGTEKEFASWVEEQREYE